MIFVTVGTTPFDDLIEYLDNITIDDEIILQISKKATYIPKNKQYFKFIKNINEYYDNAEIIISHAGAGSIYNLLELNKKIIIVPNLSRVDNHQLDIAEYMSENNFAIPCNKIPQLEKILKNSKSYNIKKYQKKSFFKSDEMKEIIDSLY